MVPTVGWRSRRDQILCNFEETMNTKQLKQLIKPLIKECMAELMLEMKIDQIIGESISKNLSSHPTQEQVERPRQKDPKIEQQLLEKRRKLLDSLHGESKRPVLVPSAKPKNILDEVLQDTEESGYAIEDGNTNPEFVSESILGDLTEGKDYSKFF